MNVYHLAVGLAVAVLFAVQQTVQLHLDLDGPTRTALGYAVTLGFLAAVAEFATLAVGRRLGWVAGGPNRGASPVAVMRLATLLLVLNLFSKKFSGYCALPRQPPPTGPLLVLVAGWLGMFGWVRLGGGSPRAVALALLGLVLGVRVLVLLVSPFDRLTGDMLPTIDRALGELFAGRFPYVDFPPPMPYLPALFLAYAPPKLLGLDLRLTNLALEVAVAAVALGLLSGTRTRLQPASIAPGRLALPFFLLHPVWVYYGVNTQFAPCLLAAVLLGRAVCAAGPRCQAIALGVAVGSSQMLGVCGPILFGHWIAWHGPRRAVGLSALAVAVFLALIGPFLLWDAAQFLDLALGSRAAFSPELMSGRFTLRPLAARLAPRADLALTVAVVLVAARCAARARRPEPVVAAMALGLCGALLLQPVSFAHYFLPVIALAASAPVPVAPGERPPSCRPPGRADGPSRVLGEPHRVA